MTKIIAYEMDERTQITDFRRSPKGKRERVVKWKDWKGDRKKLKEEAEKPERGQGR